MNLNKTFTQSKGLLVVLLAVAVLLSGYFYYQENKLRTAVNAFANDLQVAKNSDEADLAMDKLMETVQPVLKSKESSAFGGRRQASCLAQGGSWVEGPNGKNNHCYSMDENDNVDLGNELTTHNWFWFF